MAIPSAQELTELISFKNVSPPYSVNGYGTEVSTYGTAYARIVEGGGSVDNEDMQHQRQVQGFEVFVNYDPGLTGFMEIEWGSRRLKMTPPQKILDSRNRQWSVIQAEEVTERSV